MYIEKNESDQNSGLHNLRIRCSVVVKVGIVSSNIVMCQPDIELHLLPGLPRHQIDAKPSITLQKIKPVSPTYITLIKDIKFGYI